jgi:hypothetical protein
MPVSQSGALDLDKATNGIRNDSDPSIGSKPKGIIDAVSEIQHYHVFEMQQESDINKNFFTLRQVFDFFKIGFKSGFIESLFFVLAISMFQNIYPSFKEHFLKQNLFWYEHVGLFLLSYMPIVIMTIWLSFLFRLYDGAITKKSIFSLLSGRSLAFLVKSILVYYLFNFLYDMAMYDKDSTYVMISYINKGISFLFMLEYSYKDIDLYAYYYAFIVPAIQNAATYVAVSMFIFATIPFFTVVGKGVYVNFKRKKGETEYEQY